MSTAKKTPIFVDCCGFLFLYIKKQYRCIKNQILVHKDFISCRQGHK